MIYIQRSTFTYACYTNKFSSIKEIIGHMIQLEYELAHTDMENLIAFNHTYLIITQAVAEHFGKDYFYDDYLMERFDIQFATYYFDALKKYTNKEDTPPAWQLLFELCKKNKTYQFIYMALGVNAHVNNDLGQALGDINPHKNYRKDFDKVNIIIREQIPLVVSSLEETSFVVNRLKNMCRPLYAVILFLLIKSWRQNAWNTYTGLHNGTLHKNKIEEKAKRIGQLFARLKKII